MVYILILDMKRHFINLFRKIDITNDFIKQQRTIQTSVYRLQSVEEVFIYFNELK